MRCQTHEARNKGAKRAVRTALVGFSGVLLLAISSCATVPKIPTPSGTALAALMPSQSLVYASMKVSRNRKLIGEVLKASGVSSSMPAAVIEKTKSLLASVSYGNDKKPVVSFAALGDFPVGLMKWRLNWSRDWAKEKAPIQWWQEKKTGAQIALPSKQLLLFSNGDLPQMLRKYTGSASNPLNPTVRQAFAASDLAVYVPTLSTDIPLFNLDVRRFPVNSFYFALTAQNGAGGSVAGSPGVKETATAPTYQGVGVFDMKSDRDARLFSVVFKLLIASSGSGSPIAGFPIPLSGAQLSVDGRTIRLTGLSVSEKDLSSLLAKMMSRKGSAGSQ